MRKIPTLFKRDPENMRSVLPEVTLGCEWVLEGEGVGTRKYDGTCVRLSEGGVWWARREVRPGKTTPQLFILEETDPTTGKTVGWEPISSSSFVKWHRQALENMRRYEFEVGTYELCGPKINGNPEGLPEHRLIRHADAQRLPAVPNELSFESLRDLVVSLNKDEGWEGIVWHHPDGRMAKLKARDFKR